MLNRLLLITQLHRSGGTLFSQLLDCHSAIQAHPHELFIGKPKKWNWPRLQEVLGSPDQVFESLQEPTIALIAAKGTFVKPGSNPQARKQEVPFTYSIEDHRRIFREHYTQAPIKSQRLAIQIYLSTFFQAWPEHHSSGSEHYVSCFLPHLIVHPGSVQRLLYDFPDVLMVSLLRQPGTWIASLVNHLRLDIDDTEAIQKHLERWQASVESILRLDKIPCLHTFTTSYEALVSMTRDEMRRFALTAGIPFEPILLTPTVGGYPVLPNSSYSRGSSGVNQASLNKSIQFPGPVETMIQDIYTPLYHKAVAQLGIPEATTT